MLYATNTFYISSALLLRHARLLLLPHRLAAVASLELVVPLQPRSAVPQRDPSEVVSLEHPAHGLAAVCRNLAVTFPGLASLNLVLDGRPCFVGSRDRPRPDLVEERERACLVPVDGLVRVLAGGTEGRLRECVVALPYELCVALERKYAEFLKVDEGRTVWETVNGFATRKRHWREVGMGPCENGDGEGSAQQEVGGKALGYWVTEGCEPFRGPVNCFGA